MILERWLNHISVQYFLKTLLKSFLLVYKIFMFIGFYFSILTNKKKFTKTVSMFEARIRKFINFCSFIA